MPKRVVELVVVWAPNGDVVVAPPPKLGLVAAGAPKAGGAALVLFCMPKAEVWAPLAGVAAPKAGGAAVDPKPVLVDDEPKIELLLVAGAFEGAPNCGVGLIVLKLGRPPLVEDAAVAPPSWKVDVPLVLGAAKLDVA